MHLAPPTFSLSNHFGTNFLAKKKPQIAPNVSEKKSSISPERVVVSVACIISINPPYSIGTTIPHIFIFAVEKSTRCTQKSWQRAKLRTKKNVKWANLSMFALIKSANGRKKSGTQPPNVIEGTLVDGIIHIFIMINATTKESPYCLKNFISK